MTDNFEEELPSKTQKKREADAMQKLGVELVALPATKLDTLPLPTPLKDAILAAKKMKAHGAVRRQAQFIGKLMRGADFEAIHEAYQTLVDERQAVTANFHELELWRDRLIKEGKPALTAYIEAHKPEDIQQLRHLVDKAISEYNTTKPVGAQKALFRFLRDH